MADWKNLHTDMLTLVARYFDLDTRPPSFLRCLFMLEIGCFRYPSFLPLHCSSSHATRRRSGRGPRFTDKTSLLHLPRQVFQALGTLTTGRFLHWVIWWWLILVHRNLNMSLFNPFSRQRFPFPPVSSFPQLGNTMVVRRSCIPTAAALSSCVTANLTDPKDLTVMVAHGWAGKLAFAKPGESSWQIVDKGDNLFPERKYCILRRQVLYSRTTRDWSGVYYGPQSQG